MKTRKTFEVAELLTKVNAYLASDSKYVTADMRKGAASVLETVLHATGNYEGYNYLDWLNGGFEAWVAAGKPEDRVPFVGDETRRVYWRKPEAPKVPTTGATVGRDFPKGLG